MKCKIKDTDGLSIKENILYYSLGNSLIYFFSFNDSNEYTITSLHTNVCHTFCFSNIMKWNMKKLIF